MKILNSKNIKKVMCIIGILVLIPFVTLFFYFIFVPLGRTDKGVQKYVLRRVPIGTDYKEVLNIIEQQSWRITDVDNDGGLLINETYYTASFASYSTDLERFVKQPNIRLSGVKAVLVRLGEFYIPAPTVVYAYMAFDENDQLLEVVIRRDVDGP
ncbi:MAG: hypothetical protein K5659_03695 [Lachnospiraceae bacterium]|nr:hypothetical protein [Lachnospiraceae bacterium]